MSNIMISSFWSSMPNWLASILSSILLMIDFIVYVFINWMYRIFTLVAKVDIFSSGTQIADITRRIYIIVGIAMLFIFAYNLILLIINPEGKQLGNMGKVIQNAIVSIILVTLLPLIFSYLTTVQNHILDSGVIAHVILGTSAEDSSVTNKTAGVDTALTIFSAFYHPDGQTYNSCLSSCDNSDESSWPKTNCDAHDLCTTYVNTYHDARDNDSIYSFIWDDSLRDGVKNGKMEYTGLISTAAGLWALWCFISFALDIGVRVGKLAFYEIISPIPIMMRILPNDKMFDKWFNGIKNTYLSLFVRLAVIYFCMYAITLVPDILTNMWAKSGEDNMLLLALANVVIILGILQFAKDAPKLISDLFGGAGDGLDFRIAGKVKDNKLAMAGMGLAGGGATALASNVRKMFSFGEKDPETGKRKIQFKGSNPLRGVVRGAATAAYQGGKSTTFGQLGAAITAGKDKANEVNEKYKSRHNKGENWVKNKNDGNRVGDVIRGDDPGFIRKGVASVVDNIVEGTVGRGMQIKDAVVKGGKGTLDYLNTGAEVSSAAEKNVNSALNAIEKAFKSFSGGISPIEDTAKAWREAYDVDGKIPKALNEKLDELISNGKIAAESADKCSRDQVLQGIKAWEKDSKMAQYEKNFSGNERALEAFKDTIVSALKDSLPYMSTEAKAKISFDKLETLSGAELARELDSVQSTLKKEKNYIEAMRFQKAEESKK